MSGNRLTRLLVQLVAVAALVLVGLVLVWEGGPVFSRWHKQQLAGDLSQEIANAPDGQAKLLVHQLAAIGTPAIGELVAASHEPRELIAQTARAEINILFAARRISVLNEPTAKDIQVLEKLAAALAENAEEFGPAGSRWAEALALELVSLSERFPPRPTAAILRHTERVLAAIAPQGPRLRTVDTSPTLQESEAGSLPNVRPLDVRQLNVPTEQTLRPASPALATEQQAPAEAAGEELAAQPLESSVEIRSNVDANGAELPQRNLAWSPAGESSLSVEVAEPRTSAPRAGLVRVPSPQESQRKLAQLRKVPTQVLLEKLPHADRFTAGSIRLVLERRGLSRAEIEITTTLAAGSEAERLALIEQTSQLSSKSARRVLRLLLKDSHAEVRLRALTTLATTNDPGLAELARELALQDRDPRVAELASELMRR